VKPLTGKEFGKLLEAHGWVLLRISGSHHVYGKPGNPLRISVPMHGNAALKRGLQRHLIRIAGLPGDQDGDR